MSGEDEDELEGGELRFALRRKGQKTYRFEKCLSGVPKDERKSQDYCGKGDERRQSVSFLEDQEADEENNEQRDDQADTVEFGDNGPHILRSSVGRVASGMRWD